MALLNLLDLNTLSVTEKPLHRIANENVVTNIYLVPISIEIRVPTRIPRLKVIALNNNETMNVMVEEKELRLSRRAADSELSPELMDKLLCDFDSSNDNNELIMQSYAVIKVILNGDDYMIQYESQGCSDDFSFHGDRNCSYHLAFECDIREIMLLNEKDFGIYCVKQPWRVSSREICSLCCSPRISWALYPCKHMYCSIKCMGSLENKPCFNGFAGSKCRKLLRKDAIEGFMDDGFCNYDQCMERQVLNLPCQCITCYGNERECSRCGKKVEEQICTKPNDG